MPEWENLADNKIIPGSWYGLLALDDKKVSAVKSDNGAITTTKERGMCLLQTTGSGRTELPRQSII